MTTRKFLACITFVLLLPMVIIPAQACTTFIIGDSSRQLFGRNYDWHFSDGYIMVNKKGLRKKVYSSAREPNGQPATWISRFGSITFNQFGREFPQGGMNETGLIIESMSLMNTEYPRPDDRPYVRSANLWRQYILDTCASVRDVIDSDHKIRISEDASSIGTHFLVLDRSGDAAAIAFLDGTMVVHTGKALPVRVLTNTPYGASLPYWKSKRPPWFDRWHSIKRFATAAALVSEYAPNETGRDLDHAFQTLAAVSSSTTRWSIVYDNINMEIFFRTDDNARIRRICWKAFDFSCKKPAQLLNIHADVSGDISHAFVDYSSEVNAGLVRTSCAKLAASTAMKLSPEVVELLGRFPDQFSCGE